MHTTIKGYFYVPRACDVCPLFYSSANCYISDSLESMSSIVILRDVLGASVFDGNSRDV